MTITFTGGINIPQGQLIVDRNRAPTWVSAENLGSNHEGITITAADYSVVATDLDDDPLTYSLVSGTLPTSATLNSNGTITGPVASVSSNTTFNFTARVSDGLQTVDKAFSISVNQNASPVWSTAADLGSVDENDAVSIQLTATDADSLPLTLAYSKVSGTLPSGVLLSSAGLLSGTAPEETSTTVYMFTVRATDGLDTADRQFSLTVTNIVDFSALPVTTNLVFHVDADNASTITTVSGDVSQWNDQAGTANNATQSVAGNRPTLSPETQNGRDGVSFDQTDQDYLTVSDQAEITDIWDGGGYIMVAVHWSGVNKGALMEKEAKATDFRDGGWDIQTRGTAGSFIELNIGFSGGSFFGQFRTTTAFPTTPVLYEIAYNSDSVVNTPTVKFNGVDAGNNTAVTPVGTRRTDVDEPMIIGNLLRIVSSFAFTGDGIFEIAIFDAIPSSGDQTTLRDHFNTKWGLGF